MKLIFGQYLELRSTVKLAAWLNDHGHRQKVFSSRRRGTTGGKKFSIPVLQGMLANRLYLGEIEHKGEVFKGQHEAIVGPEVFDRVQQILEDNNKNLRIAPERAKYEYLLTGTLRCACGYAVTTSAGRAKGKSYHYYRCVGLQKVDRHACPVRQVRADAAEATVLSIVRDAARNPKLLEEAIAEANRLARDSVDPLRQQVALLRREKAAAAQAAERLLDQLLAAGASGSATAKRRLAEAEEKAEQLERALSEAEGKLAVRETEHLNAEVIVQALRSFDEAFEYLSVNERREFIRLMIKQVTVHKDRVVVDLYEGRQATRFLVAVATAESVPPSTAPGGGRASVSVHQGFVNECEWLPAEDAEPGVGRRPLPDLVPLGAHAPHVRRRQPLHLRRQVELQGVRREPVEPRERPLALRPRAARLASALARGAAVHAPVEPAPGRVVVDEPHAADRFFGLAFAASQSARARQPRGSTSAAATWQ